MTVSEIPALSYNQWMEQYGGTYEDFSTHSLAYMLQQKRADLDARTIAEWEARLVGTIYEVSHE